MKITTQEEEEHWKIANHTISSLTSSTGSTDFEGSEQEDFQTVLRAAEETETTQENIQDWLELDEGDPEFQF
jgi:hypothetical protein